MDKQTKVHILKVVALITMLIDHVGLMIFPGVILFRTIGRISFPLFAYGLVVGYKNTSDKKRYAKNLLIFAIISQLPYAFFNPELAFEPFNLNIMITLLLGLFILIMIEHIKKYKWLVMPLLLLLVLPEILRFSNIPLDISYGTYGFLLVILFYYLYSSKYLIPSFIVFTISYLFLYSSFRIVHHLYREEGILFVLRYYFLNFKEVSMSVLFSESFIKLEGIFSQIKSLLVIPFLLLRKYNIIWTTNKKIIYWFYPGHMVILIIIKYFN